MACFVFLGMAFSFIKLISSSDILTKREMAILKICPPAIITSAEVIYYIYYISNRPHFLWVYRRDKPRGMLGEQEKSL